MKSFYGMSFVEKTSVTDSLTTFVLTNTIREKRIREKIKQFCTSQSRSNKLPWPVFLFSLSLTLRTLKTLRTQNLSRILWKLPSEPCSRWAKPAWWNQRAATIFHHAIQQPGVPWHLTPSQNSMGLINPSDSQQRRGPGDRWHKAIFFLADKLFEKASLALTVNFLLGRML